MSVVSLLLATAGFLSLTVPDSADPALVSRRITEQFLSTVPDRYCPEGFKSTGDYPQQYGSGRLIHYSVVSLWLNALECARLSGNAELERKLVERFEPYYGAKSGVLPELGCEKADAKLDEAAHMVCLHIAANAPKYVKPEEVPQAEIDAELEIKLNALKEQKGKLPPEQALVGIKKGMAAKFCSQICLLKQDYVADGEITVEQYLANVGKELGAAITVKRFARFQLGA